MAVQSRPQRLRKVCAASAVVVVVVFAVIGLLLRRGSAGGVVFTVADQVAMVGLGVVLAGVILLLARPRLDADETGLRVRNILTSYELPWQVVREVSFSTNSPWATLELADDDTVALLAVQAADGERALQTVRALRRLHADAVAPSRGTTPEGGGGSLPAPGPS